MYVLPRKLPPSGTPDPPPSLSSDCSHLPPHAHSKEHKAAVLSLHMPQSGTLVSGSCDKHVRIFDLRIPVSVVALHHEHTKPVLCLAATDNYVYSGSEDKSLCVWDRRAQRLLQRIKVSVYVGPLRVV